MWCCSKFWPSPNALRSLISSRPCPIGCLADAHRDQIDVLHHNFLNPESMHACMQAGWSWGWVGLDPTGPGWTGTDRTSPCSPIVLLNSQTILPPPATEVAEAAEQGQTRVWGVTARQLHVHAIYCLPVCWLTGLLACWSTKHLTLFLCVHLNPIGNVHVRVYVCVCAYVYVCIYVCACLCHLECLSNKACPLCDESGASQQLPSSWCDGDVGRRRSIGRVLAVRADIMNRRVAMPIS